MEVCVKINCLHDECIEVSLRDDSPPLKSIPWEPDFEKAAELNNTVIKTMRGQKVTKKGLNLRGQAAKLENAPIQELVTIKKDIEASERLAEEAAAKRKESQETGVYTTGGIIPAKAKREKSEVQEIQVHLDQHTWLEPKEENLAEKSREKIKLLRESIIKEIHDGISQSS